MIASFSFVCWLRLPTEWRFRASGLAIVQHYGFVLLVCQHSVQVETKFQDYFNLDRPRILYQLRNMMNARYCTKSTGEATLGINDPCMRLHIEYRGFASVLATVGPPPTSRGTVIAKRTILQRELCMDDSRKASHIQKASIYI